MIALCNESQTACNEKTCLLCGASLKTQSRGRARQFCSIAHRVRYHRTQKRSDNGEGQTECGANERLERLHKLADILEDLRPPGRVAELRRIAEQTASLSLLFDTPLAPDPRTQLIL